MNHTPETPDPVRGGARGEATVPLSVLDLATVGSGTSATAALHTTTAVARQAEELGYHRLWVAEHHSMPGIASSAPAVLLAHLAAHTTTIRLGSGGVMLPNHAPLVVAEQFGTLEALHPGRIDLGLGRAPGTDQATTRALRRHNNPDPDDFDAEVGELVGFLDDAHPAGHPYTRIHAVPGPAQAKLAGASPSRPPVWLLGSSDYGARLAARLGLPFAFAHHFAARNTIPALRLYRENFTPSAVLDRPYAMIAASAVAADTEREAARLARTMALAMLRVRGGRPGLMPLPEEAEAYRYSEAEAKFVHAWLTDVAFGEPDAVRAALDRLVAATGADELMIATNVYGHESRLRSYRLIAEAYRMV